MDSYISFPIVLNDVNDIYNFVHLTNHLTGRAHIGSGNTDNYLDAKSLICVMTAAGFSDLVFGYLGNIPPKDYETLKQIEEKFGKSK